jgi:NhaP-type Na+/H+ or K+/H+ antiporter
MFLEPPRAVVLFESALTLLLVAIALLQVSRKLPIPYPTMLAMAGVVVGALPWAPDISSRCLRPFRLAISSCSARSPWCSGR